MRPGVTMVLGLAVAVVLSGCAEPGKGEHDLVVALLSNRAEQEDGWLKYTLPVRNEGGGDITWWLHPCDPQIDVRRDLTATVYQGSDIQGEPGHFGVEQLQAECVGPGREIEVPPRTFVLDVDVIPLWPSVREAPDGARIWAPDPDVEQVTITDPVDGSRHALSMFGDQATGPCDGTTTWSATWHEQFLTLGTRSCLATLAVLPDPVLELLEGQLPRLDRDEGSLHLPDVAALETVQDDIADEMVDAGWVLLRDRQTDTWSGPCQDIGYRHERSVASIGAIPFHGGDPPYVARARMTSEPCAG